MKRYLWALETRYNGIWSVYDVMTNRAEARKEAATFDRKLYRVRIVRYVSER